MKLQNLASQPMLWGLALAIALKQFYSVADASQLQWMLWPLARLLEGCSALSFQPLPAGLWLDAAHGISLVKACAGVNFLIISLLGYVWRWRRAARPWAVLPKSLAAAWLTALLANALRILGSVYGGEAWLAGCGLSPAASHRLIGIAVYFPCLWAQLAGFRWQELRRAAAAAAFWYCAVALLLPLARAWALGLGGIGWEHSAWVAGIPLGVVALCGICGLRGLVIGPRRLFHQNRGKVWL
jgi:exosortase K